MLLPRLGLVLLFSLLPCLAQNGDHAGEEQQAPAIAAKAPPAPPLTPAEALKTFKLQPGFHMELVASEPMIEDPVAVAFDPDGKIFVLEMRGFMRDADGNGQNDPLGRVTVLEDTDGDGEADKSHVFVDGLVMPRAIALVRGGLLVAEPPKLWFFRDTNGDGKADEKIEVSSDYGSQENPEHTSNGLMWGLDNWIYSANHTIRYRNINGTWEKGPTAFGGQWGISQDDYGRIFHNSNSDPLRADLIPSQYLARNPYFRATAGVNVQIERSLAVWPIRPNPGVNRGYQKGQLREDGTLATFTGACGPCIYRGDNFPSQYRGSAFLCEPTGNIIRSEQLTEKDGLVSGTNAFEHNEFLASTDERFRPVNLYTGPDGCLYVVDMYHGILQHRIYLTTYLRNQALSRGLQSPVNLGRIYRIVSDQKPGPAPHLSSASPAELVKALSNPNGWWRMTAQQLLVERNDAAVGPALEALARGSDAIPALHAMWTLDGMRQLKEAIVVNALSSRDPKLRVHALRLSEQFLRNAPMGELSKRVLALTSDSAAEVRWQLMMTLGEIQTADAEQAMLALLKNESSNVYLNEAALSGVSGRELQLIQKIVSGQAADGSLKPILLGLAKSVANHRNADMADQLLTIAVDRDPRIQATLLDGLLSLTPAATKGKEPPKTKPLHFKAEPAAFLKLHDVKSPEIERRVAKLDKFLIWPDKPGVPPEEIVKPLTKDEQARFDAGKELFTVTCAACHQPHGLGQEGLAPPIADSDWITGPPGRLIRIVINGVRGKINVKGRTYEMEMPPLGVFDNDQIAQVLTYVRREWGHTSSSVDTAFVNKVREQTVKREEAWTEGELSKIAE
ncbi:MAG: dehydrogenase [Verrucomicrobiales bacterium]|nr:dehydrogenase [Verrucomicrobiales bacterium]